MLITLENEFLCLKVDTLGAQMLSLTHKGTEYLWQGDPQYWEDRAPNLFPFIGRLWNNSYTYRGKPYHMGIHGFAAQTEFAPIEQGSSYVLLSCSSTIASLVLYPFDFTLNVTYRLVKNTVEITFFVRNQSLHTMPFGIGGHPGFRVPIGAGEAFEDYYLEFSIPCQPDRVGFTPEVYLSGHDEAYPLEDGRILRLKHNLFDEDAIILKNMCREVTLRSEKSGHFVHVSYPQMSYLGIWHWPKTDAPYVCIEPWTSLPARQDTVEEFSCKSDLIHLLPGKTYENTWTITIGEENMIDVVALGELLIDFATLNTDSDGYPTMAAHPGGAPANFLAALTKFGASTALLGKVGSDTFGKLLIGTLQKAGIETKGLVVTDDVFTTLAFVTFDEHGDREFAFSRKPGADTCLCFEEIDLSLIDEAKVFHFGTLSLTDEPARSATYKAVAYAKSKGKLITYDPNLRKPLWKSLDTAKEQLIWGLNYADVVKISDEEVEFLFGLGVEEGAEYILKNFGVKLVFVTCGADGCYFKNAVASGHVPSLHGIKVIDTTGAGDIFGGSAVWKLLQTGKAPETLNAEELTDVVRFACTSAGLSTTKSGGISSVHEYGEILSRM